MSHAANLRLRQALDSTSAKRRKLSDPESSAAASLLNGLSSKKFHATPAFDIKNARRKQTDESDVVVGRGQEDADMHDVDLAADSQSDVHDQDDDDDEEEAVDDSAADSDEEGQQPRTNGHTSLRPAATGADETSALDADNADPSFGDLLRGRTATDAPIDVSLSTADTTLPTLLATQRPSALALPSATTLSTVLTQSLRTNDTALLESCLQVPHLDSIRSTIERLAPALASLLLQKLAERMHKRPGRAGSLMVWVQWTVVAHGGYLACQPAAMKQLHTLYTVVKQRATGLQPLLQLKGKLDMLEAQMQLRRNMQVRSLQRGEDVGVIYVEGEDEEHNASELSRGKHAKNVAIDGSEEDEDDDDEMPQTLANGISEDDDEDDEVESEDDQDLLIDDEAEVDSAEDSDGLSEDVDLESDDDEDENEEVEAEDMPIKTRSRG